MFNNSFIKIAYSNLWRRKSRTVLVIMMISIGLAGMIYSQGLYDGMMVQMLNDQIRTATGELAIYKKGYEENNLLSLNIKSYAELEEYLKSNKKVKYFVSRIRSEGVVSSAKYSQAASIVGINADLESQFINYKNAAIEGDFAIEPETKQMIIGDQLAKKLKVKVGKKLVIQGQNLNKEISAIAGRVVAIVKTNNPMIDSATVFIDKASFKKFFKVDGVSEFSLLLDEPETIAKMKHSLSNEINALIDEDLEFFTWRELYPIVLLWDKVMKYFIYISYAIVFLVVALGVFFILFISIIERIKEFGILIAVGTSFSNICKIVFWESLLMGVIGYLIGSLSAYGLLLLTNINGLDLTYFASGLNDIGMAAIIYADIRAQYFILAFNAVFFSSIVAGCLPLWKLKRLKAVEAIRFT